MPCSVICISHATGSGGEEVGRLVAERLGFRHVDDQIVADAAARGGIDPADVADAERRKSFAQRILDAISSNTVAASGGLPVVLDDGPAADEIQALIREAIEQTAGRGTSSSPRTPLRMRSSRATERCASSSLRRRVLVPGASASRRASTTRTQSAP